jgi:hypothetical protein
MMFDSWHALHGTRPPKVLDEFLDDLPMQDYFAIRNWMDRVLREAERVATSTPIPVIDPDTIHDATLEQDG